MLTAQPSMKLGGHQPIAPSAVAKIPPVTKYFLQAANSGFTSISSRLNFDLLKFRVPG
jgi:hypothetical protein